MFWIAICDDDNNICTYIEKTIITYKEKNLLDLDVEVFLSGEELCNFIKKEHSFDLIFFDIELKGISGIQAANFIRTEICDQTALYVYISGKEDCFKEMIETRPMGFIHKPLDTDKIITYVSDAMKLSDILDKSFRYKKGHIPSKKNVKNIIYFESNGREIKMVTIDGIESFYGKLSDIYARVCKYRFMNIHKSYIVNYYHVNDFKYEEVIMSNGVHLPISQLKRKEIRRMQIDYELEDCK